MVLNVILYLPGSAQSGSAYDLVGTNITDFSGFAAQTGFTAKYMLDTALKTQLYL